MRATHTILGVAAIAAAVSGALWLRRSGAAQQQNTGSGSSLSNEQRQRVIDFWAAFRAGDELQRNGEFAKALPEYRRALELDPRHEGSLYNIANCLIELGRFDDALAPLKKLVIANPMSQRGHLQIGLVCSSPGAGRCFDLVAAEKALQRAFRINQEESGSLLRLAGVALVTGDEKRAVRFYRLANQSNFRAVEGYYVRAYVAWQGGKSDVALRLMQEALKQSGKPKVVAGVPGEGDTREGSKLPPSTMEDKRLIKPFWRGLTKRYADSSVAAEDLPTEFAALHASLLDLQRR